MTIEIVDFPIENGDFPISYVSLPEGMRKLSLLALVPIVSPCFLGQMQPGHWPQKPRRMSHQKGRISIHLCIPSGYG